MTRIGAAVCALLFAVACGGDEAAGPPAPSNVTGTIVEVEPDDGEPTSFVVEADDGETYTIEIDPEIDYGFDLGHLHEHQESGDAVAVDIHVRDDTLYALSIEDV